MNFIRLRSSQRYMHYFVPVNKIVKILRCNENPNLVFYEAKSLRSLLRKLYGMNQKYFRGAYIGTISCARNLLEIFELIILPGSCSIAKSFSSALDIVIVTYMQNKNELIETERRIERVPERANETGDSNFV